MNPHRGQSDADRPWVGPRAPLAALLFALAACSAASGGNLVPNGGIEAPSETDPDLPKGWTPHAHGKVSTAWAAAGACSGKRCLQMAADPAEKWGHAYWTSAPIAVKPCMAYRVRFHFKAKGFGVPCFSLARVKEWRLFKGDTDGKWLPHEDVVVIPPDVTTTAFHANNYHRPGKTLWLDDVSLVELPLSESPLTKRLLKAKKSLAALESSLSRFRLTLEQRTELAALRKRLSEAEAAYATLEAGKAAPADFRQMSAALGAIENAVGRYLLTVWTMDERQWARRSRRPSELSRVAEASLTLGPDGAATCLVGVVGLVGEGLATRLTLATDRRARGWGARLLVAPAHRLPSREAAEAWGELSSLGELFLPPGTPRFLRLEVTAPHARPGVTTFRIDIDCLDRTAERARVTVQVTKPR